MESNWVDFKAVKQTVTMRAVLEHYGIKGLRQSRGELRGQCPIHKGEGEDSFHANTEKNCFHCFSCKASGNVLDFVAAMERCTVREAALRLQQWFSVGAGNGKVHTAAVAAPATPAESRGEGSAENKPLQFQLKNVDPEHAYLRDRGIQKETAEMFGVGFFSGKGSTSGRVVIPIHNERGELVAYAGRSIDGSEPKYKLPAGFHKSAELFNFHRALQHKREAGISELIVVEGFFDTLKVHQAGFPGVVGLMGCSISETQVLAIAQHFDHVTIMPDNDEAGMRMMVNVVNSLMFFLYVRVEMPDVEGQQPDQLSEEEIRAVLGRRQLRPRPDSWKKVTAVGEGRLQIVR
jgi:DNA primase